jgi:uncharacterized protein YecE (DUF72 family)
MATLFAGTSGFAYPAWKPRFYPADLPAARFLEYYAGRLNCVEINYTFRHLPSASTLAAWVRATPPGFLFAVKAHQRITHMLRLRGAEQITADFLKALDPLREAGRLGPVLFQLPPNLKSDPERLAAYLALLPADLRFAFEFRHTSWFTDDTYELLRRRGVALCVAESEKLAVPDVVTADFAYYRMRKPAYSEAEIAGMANRARELLADERDLFLMFKHEEDAGGAEEAERLLRAA